MAENNTNQTWRLPPTWHTGPGCSRTFLNVGGFLYVTCVPCGCICNLEAVAARETYAESGRPS